MNKSKMTILLGVLCLSAGTVLGAVGTTIKAQLVQMNIVKDSKQVLQDTKVISYNGTTYVPLRAFGEVSGVAISYKDGTVYLGNNNGSSESVSGVASTSSTREDYKNDFPIVYETSKVMSNILTDIYNEKGCKDDKWISIAEQCKIVVSNYDKVYPTLKTKECKDILTKQRDVFKVLSEEIMVLHDSYDLEVIKQSLNKISKSYDEVSSSIDAALEKVKAMAQ